jgi:hypothetical protein
MDRSEREVTCSMYLRTLQQNVVFLITIGRRKRMKTTLCLIFGSLLLVGCAHKINYKLTEEDRWRGPKINGALYVKSFADQTVSITNKVERIEGKKWRTNFRKGYAETNLTAAVTAMIAKHIAHSGLFSKGVSGLDSDADWILSGELANFDTRAQVNDTAENVQAVSAGFGALGALVGGVSTSKMTSEIKTHVELSDLKLSDKNGSGVWRDSIVITNSVAANFNAASKQAVFYHPDENLKKAVAEMIQRMGNSRTNASSAAIR